MQNAEKHARNGKKFAEAVKSGDFLSPGMECLGWEVESSFFFAKFFLQ